MKSSWAPFLSLIASLTLVLGLYVLVKRYQEVLVRDSLMDLGRAQAALLEQNRLRHGHGADFTSEQKDYPSRWFLISDAGFANSQTLGQFVFERQRVEPIVKEFNGLQSDFLETPGGQIFWLATPLTATAGCVECHNTHPQSSKTDWMTGDIMGSQVLLLPASTAGQSGSTAFRDIIIFLSIFFTVAILITLISQARSQRALETVQRREAESRLLSLVAARTDNAVIITDPRGTTEWVNDGYTRLTGYSLAEVSQTSIEDLLLSDDTPRDTRDRIRTALRDHEPFSGITHNLTKDGRAYWIAVDGQPIFDEAGRLSNFIAIQRDITDLKDREAELENARLLAEEANKSKSQFLANMSHEIRTPMNGIIGMTQLMLETALGPKQRHYADTIRISGEALLDIVNDILDFSKIDAGQIKLAEAPFHLQTVLIETVEILSPRAMQKGLSLNYQIDEALEGWFLGDKGRLRQVLLNLISNAIKFTDSGSVMLIAKPAEDPGKVYVAIKDTGIGIPSDRLDDVFKSFSQIDASSSRRFEGTGLGLSISQQLIEAMGGLIGVQSIEGMGSTFWFTLPLRALADGTSLSKIKQDGIQPVFALRKLNVLVAEDNLINQQVAQGFLKKLGHSVQIANNGHEAVSAVQNGSFDLLFMDVQMPEMDGLEATAHIRALPAPHCNIPIIAMTANAMKGDEEHCLKHGMSDYLAKPILLDQLRERIERWFYGEFDAGADSDTGSNSQDIPPMGMDIDNAIQQHLREQLGEPMLQDILEVFSSDTIERLAVLDSALERRDFDAVAKQAHSIKGSAASLGLNSIVSSAFQLEQAAAGDGSDKAALDVRNQALQAAMQHFEDWMQQRHPSQS